MDQSHLDAKYFIDSKVYNCPFCNRRNVSYVIQSIFEFDWTPKKRCHGYLVRCQSCQRVSMHLSYDLLRDRKIVGPVPFFKDTVDIDSKIFYSVPTSFFTIDDRVPKLIRELIAEAEGSLKMNFLTGASACMRKAIYELLVHEETDSASDYKDRIKSLKLKYDSVNPELFHILGGIQQMTSEKVHEQSWDKWDSANLRLIIVSLKEILYEIYVRPDEQTQQMNRIKQLKAEAAQAKARSEAPGEEDRVEGETIHE